MFGQLFKEFSAVRSSLPPRDVSYILFTELITDDALAILIGTTIKHQGNQMRLFISELVMACCTLNSLACAASPLFNDSHAGYGRSLISARELSRHESDNAYDLIRKLRPQWLRGRDSKSTRYLEVSYPVVYINKTRHGEIDSLHHISTQEIKEIKFFQSSAAAIMFGLSNVGGAILITI
jgi:hypothetical protein